MVVLGGWLFLMSEVPLYLGLPVARRERIFIGLTTSDRELKASRKGSK